MQKNLPLVLLLSLGVLWGTGYSIARFAVTHGVSPLGYSFWQSLGPALLLTLIVVTQKINFSVSFDEIQYYFVCGLTGIAIPNTNMYFAAQHLPAGLLAVIVNTVPIMAYVLALLTSLEDFNFKRFIAVMVAVAGLMVLLIPKTSLPKSEMIPWVLLALITPFSFALCSVYITRYRPKNSTTLGVAAGTLIFSSILLTPVMLLMQDFYLPHLPFQTADWVILLEILLSTLGYIVFFKLLKIAGPVYYSFVDTIVAATGLVWGYVIFGEKLNFMC